MKIWKLKEIKFVRENLKFSDLQLAKLFNVTETALHALRMRNKILRPSDGRFKKGSIPANKGTRYNPGGRSSETRFKKGQTPHNAFRRIGDVYVVPDKGKNYTFIKLKENRRYPYGRYVWEQATGEKLTNDEIIRFRDGDPGNCDFSNLMKVSKRQNIAMNHNRKKASQSMKNTWAVVKTFEDFGIEHSTIKLRTKRKVA